MGVETKQFRANVRTWLISISGVTSKIGSGASARAYVKWPIATVELPLILLDMVRQPQLEYPFPAWKGAFEITLHASSTDTLDEIEDAIVVWLQDSTNAILTTLTTAGTVKCQHFLLAELGRNTTGVFEFEGVAYTTVARTLVFACSFAALSEDS